MGRNIGEEGISSNNLIESGDICCREAGFEVLSKR
jgi:hypothetical protein